MKETPIMNRIKYALSNIHGVRIFRNNVGVAKYASGGRVAYGLIPGSSDLIGWKTITITPEMVGREIAVFVAIETKAPGGHISVTQTNFINRVQEAGGIAGVVTSEDEARRLVEGI